MPKIIENLRAQLLEETKRQIIAAGYGSITIRSVASACGVSVGTVYNYFESKDMLISSFVLEDWQERLNQLKNLPLNDLCGFFEKIHSALCEFSATHLMLFDDINDAKVFAAAFIERRGQLRDQLSEIILPVCDRSSYQDKDFLSKFIAEAILSWTMEQRSCEEITSVITLLLK